MKLKDHPESESVSRSLTMQFVDMDNFDTPNFEHGYTASVKSKNGEMFSCVYPGGLFDEESVLGEIRQWTLENADVKRDPDA